LPVPLVRRHRTRNGAGKTTLLRMMATVIPPTTGRLRLLGHDPGANGPRRQVRRRLGYLP
jgi:ABC-type multidrug transport system ATPase subunit